MKIQLGDNGKMINRRQMISEIRNIVEDACKRDTCRAGYGAWTHHILPVVNYAIILAKKLKADIEIVEISGLLHDYASVRNKETHEDHHLHGAKYAQEILEKYDYDSDRIERIKHCIIAHRASKDIPRETLEAHIIASADAMAHFDNVDSLLYLAYTKHKMDIDQGSKWVLDKLNRSWRKLMPEAKDIIKNKYGAIKIVLMKGDR